jgi:hypothetical protein
MQHPVSDLDKGNADRVKHSRTEWLRDVLCQTLQLIKHGRRDRQLTGCHVLFQVRDR